MKAKKSPSKKTPKKEEVLSLTLSELKSIDKDNPLEKDGSYFSLFEQEGNDESQKFLAEIPGNYFGLLLENLSRESYGCYMYGPKERYYGEWRKNKKEGIGLYKYPEDKNSEENSNFNYYLGNWMKGKRNGKGIYIWTNTNEVSQMFDDEFTLIIGDFENNDLKEGRIQVHKGKGKTGKERAMIYKGKFENNKRNDSNAVLLENKLFFMGEIKDNKPIKGKMLSEKNKKNEYNAISFTFNELEEKYEDFVKLNDEEKNNLIEEKEDIVKIFNEIEEIKDICEKIELIFSSKSNFISMFGQLEELLGKKLEKFFSFN